MSILPLFLTRRPRTRTGTGWRGGLVMAAAAMTLAAAGAVLVTGCSGPGAGSRGSVASCARYGMNAIRHYVTVTAIPAACRGLSQVSHRNVTPLRMPCAEREDPGTPACS